MNAKQIPLPPVEPTVVLVDPSPLIHLAMIGGLDLPILEGQAGYLADPQAAWEIVAEADPRANPAMNYQLIQAARP